MKKIHDKSLEQIANQLGWKNGLMCAQIGVWGAEDAEAIIQKLSVRSIYLIDPYRPAKHYDDVIEGVEITEDNPVEKILEEKMYESMKRLESYRAHKVWMRTTSNDALEFIPGTLDYVFILRNHKYENVKSDLELYFPKLWEGGIISGHNYHDKHVSRAVEGFAHRNDLKVNVNEEAGRINWWMKK